MNRLRELLTSREFEPDWPEGYDNAQAVDALSEFVGLVENQEAAVAKLVDVWQAGSELARKTRQAALRSRWPVLADALDELSRL